MKSSSVNEPSKWIAKKATGKKEFVHYDRFLNKQNNRRNKM